MLQVEIKLKKQEGWRWDKLERDEIHSSIKQFNSGMVNLLHYFHICGFSEYWSSIVYVG